MSVGRLGVLCPLLAALTITVAPSVRAADATKRQVLPRDVVPEHYELALKPDAAALTFSGRVGITVRVLEPTRTITLNAVNLAFDRTDVDGAARAEVLYDKTLGRAALTLPKALPAGRHVIHIEYHGTIGRSTLGFFAMDYSGPDGPRRTLATNFEPADARDLLPCWDEPGLKATFSVSVDAPRDRMAISNMPVAQLTPLGPALQRVRFATTPKMSTYLLFLAVGDFERLHRSVDGVDVGIVVKRGDTPKARYALSQAARLLHYYNGYFGIRFPLPKLDLVAAPGEIQGGSMENWGAIFYSQNHLLFDTKTSTERDRQLLFLVVAHEMAHQWFGDLVTMAWWNDLWLNEGFARWMQTYAADELHPQWQTALQAAGIFESGKQADAVPSTHPIVQEVDTADQAQEQFDAITYDKGAAIITMIHAYVGGDKFRAGVRRYMRAHAYANTTDTDLWSEVQKTADLPILDIEHDLTRQEGLPLVRASAAPAGVALETTRFADDPQTLAGLPTPHWRLPLSVGPVGGPYRYLLLNGAATVARAPPLLVNAGQLGYARVLYLGGTFDALAARLGALGPMDQLGLLNDAWASGIAGYASTDRVLALASTLPADANPVVWKRVLEVLDHIDRHYVDGPQRAALRRYALRMLAPLGRHLGTAAPGEASNVEILRGQLRELQARFGDAAVIAAARAGFAAGAGTAAEQRTNLEIVAATANAAGFDALLAQAEHTADPLQKLHIYRALARVADPALARRMIEAALSDKVPAGTNSELLVRIAPDHADLTWQALAPRLDDPALPFTKLERWDLAAAVAAYSALPERIADLEAYEARSVPPEARKPFLGAVASIRRNERMARTVLPELDRWIKAHGS
ncbi:MAG TPA: M1 family metallopeptidase [Steroidobacteraceae bacterium]|nr:M1 family metallopeptidase [Steroidobacteraceae bacterium]